MRIVPPPGQVTRSVAIVGGEALRPVRSVAVVVAGRTEAVDWDDIVWFGPSFTVVVGDRRVDAVEVTFEPPGSDGPTGADGADLAEVWTHPSR